MAAAGSAENEVVADVEADTVDVGFYIWVCLQDDWTRARPSSQRMKDVVRVSWRQLWSDPTPTIYRRLIYETKPHAVISVLQVGFVGTVPQNMSCSVEDRLLIHTLTTSPEGQTIAMWVASTGWFTHHSNPVSHIEIVRMTTPPRTRTRPRRCRCPRVLGFV